MLVSTAEASFNYAVVGAVLGGLIGVSISYFIASNKKETPAAPSGGPPGNQVISGQAAPVLSEDLRIVELGDRAERVELVLGTPEKIVNLGSKTIAVYRDMKITYIDGRVADVQ